MILNLTKSSITWRIDRLVQSWQGYTHFPWKAVSKQILNSTEDKKQDPQIIVAGRRKHVVGGPQTKLIEMERALPKTTSPNVLFISSGSPPPLLAIRWAKRCGLKILLNQNGVHYPAVNKDYKRINRSIRNVHDLADFVVYQTEFCKMSFEKWVGPTAKRCSIIWNGIDLERFKPRSQRDWPSSVLRILVAGSINTETEYQYEVFPKLLELISSSKLRIAFERVQVFFAGKKPDTLKNLFQKLEKLYPATHPFVEFMDLGTYRQEQSSKIFQSADIYLHLKYKDPCPNIVAEAMASGLMVISGDSGGTSELIGDSGCLISIEDSWMDNIAIDAESVIKALESVKSISEVKALGKKARERAEKYMSLSHWVDAHKNLLIS